MDQQISESVCSVKVFTKILKLYQVTLKGNDEALNSSQNISRYQIIYGKRLHFPAGLSLVPPSRVLVTAVLFLHFIYGVTFMP